MSVYLLVLGSTIKQDEVRTFIDAQPEINDWFLSMPNSIFMISNLSAKQIYGKLREQFKEGRLFITEISSDNREGWLPREHWNKIRSVHNSGNVDS